MTLAAPPQTIHYPIAVAVMRRLKRDGVPGDFRTVEERLELDRTDPDDSRYYAVVVAGGWIALACVIVIPILLTGFVVYPLFGDEVGRILVTFFEAVFFFFLAGAAYAMGRMLWYVPQARRRLRKDGADSIAFKKSMRRSLPGNASLVFQTAVAILVLVLAL
jgi:hypothetical protein